MHLHPLSIRSGRVRTSAAACLALSLVASCSDSRVHATTSVAKDPADLPAPITRVTPELVHVDLVAIEVVADVAPGKPVWVWTFNGTVPGPMIRVMEGDTVEVTITNDLTGVEPHNLDFHAALGPGGGAAVTDVEPGESRTFRFAATRRGAYIYHCAGEGMAWEHVAHGMYGLIQVDPPGGLAPGFQEFYVGQNEWYLAAADSGFSPHLPGPAPDYDIDMEQAEAELPDCYTFNGHTQALTTGAYADAITVMQDERVRLFFVNGGPNKTASLHVIGTIFDRVYPGHPDDAVRNEETVGVPPGSAVVVELDALVPGTFQIVDHALFRVPRGALGLMHVEPLVPPTLADPIGSWPLDLYDPPAFGSEGH